DRVRVALAVELEQAVAPVERAEAERHFLVAEHLRRVDREVAARVHRRAERVEVDVAGGLGDRERGDARAPDPPDRGNDAGSDRANGHVASGIQRSTPWALPVVNQTE